MSQTDGSLEAVYFDGEVARRRLVHLEEDGADLVIREAGEAIARWSSGTVRQLEASLEAWVLTQDGGPLAARLEVPRGPVADGIIARHVKGKAGLSRESGALRIAVWSALAGVSLILSAIYLVPLLADRIAPLVPASVEQRLGRAADNQIKLVFGTKACTGTEGQAALQKLTQRVREAAQVEEEISVAVLDSKYPNAFALPGGRVYFLQGLLRRARTPDEVAGVLAHEMGHVVHRHGLRKYIQAGGTSFLIGLLFGDVSGGGAGVFAARLLIDNAYSREAERQADAVAKRAMLHLGRPPEAMGLFLQRIEGTEEGRASILSTHPGTRDRIEALREAGASTNGEPLLTDKEWRALKAICG